MNIQKLRTLWDSEKEAFKEKELGALQNFVRKVFECVDIFNLEEGKESTPPRERKDVFIQEDTDNKASHSEHRENASHPLDPPLNLRGDGEVGYYQ